MTAPQAMPPEGQAGARYGAQPVEAHQAPARPAAQQPVYAPEPGYAQPPVRSGRPAAASSSWAYGTQVAIPQGAARASGHAQVLGQAAVTQVAARAQARVPVTGRAGGAHSAAGAAAVAAAVGAPRQATPPPPRPAAQSDLRVRPLQVAFWQAAVLIVLLTFQQSPVLAAIGGTLAVILLVPSAMPWRGRWLYQWVALRTAYLGRSRTLSVPGAGDDANATARALIDFLQPGAVVRDLAFDGAAIATIAHPYGLTAVLEVDQGDHPFFAPPPRSLPSPAALLPAPEPDLPPTTVQLLVHVEPLRSVHAGARLATESYQVLTNGEVPSERRCWLAVQVRRTPEAFGDADLEAVLVNALKRTRRRLRQERVPTQPLRQDELFAAVRSLASLSAGPGGQSGLYGRRRQQRGVLEESWTGCLSEGRPQACFRITRWPESRWSISKLMLSLPATAVTLSTAVSRDPGRGDGADEVEVELVVRIAAADAMMLDAAGTRLAEQVRTAGGGTERLDGRHGAAFAATLPFGGFVG
jgi:type VII secretion protein EccE